MRFGILDLGIVLFFSNTWSAQNAGSELDFGNWNLGGGGPLVLRSETLDVGFLGFSVIGNLGTNQKPITPKAVSSHIIFCLLE